jgi:hypothetical protein
MPINDHGFLGQDVERMRLDIIARHKPFFDFAHDVNSFCQRSKFLLNVHTKIGQEVMAASMLAKMLCDYQAAITVLERGLVLQGQELLRCALEALFHIQRVAEDPSFIKTWAYTDERDRLRLFEAVQAGTGPLPARIDPSALQERIDEARSRVVEAGVKKLRVSEIRADEDTGGQSLYMLWSLPVHAAPRAVEAYVENGPPGTGISGIKWGPSEDDLDFTLAMGASVMLAVWQPLMKLFKIDVRAEIEQCHERLQAIIGDKLKF